MAPYQYNMEHRCISECAASFLFIFLMESLLANKLLPKTKGHNIGFGFVAVGVGFSVFIALQCFGFISSALNPAVTLAFTILGDIPWNHFPAIAGSQVLGSFLGAVVVWLFYMPHFSTVPEPPPKKDEDRLLRTRDDLGDSALRFASYNTAPPLHTLSSRLRSFGRIGSRAYRAEDVLGRDAVLGRQRRLERRRSVSIADLHERLVQLEQVHGGEPVCSTRRKRQRATGSLKRNALGTHEEEMRARVDGHPLRSGSLQALVQHEQKSDLYFAGAPPPGPEGPPSLRPDDATEAATEETTEDGEGGRRGGSAKFAFGRQAGRHLRSKLRSAFAMDVPTRSDRLLDASIVADQNAKLSVFCMRPSIYDPLPNLLAEVIATAVLIVGVCLISERGTMLFEPADGLYVHAIRSLYIGLLFVVLVLSLGGTGVAMNPARDFGPRLAHYLLPIAGKGQSEWYYAWIPIVGPFIGGAIGVGLHKALQMLNNSSVEGGYYDDEIGSLLDASGS
ncbi:unnamed protein product [Ostreobium quekettii]|uniref:Uncharacterized protein n=1 Tax=Ostreobium quekettii TaxID=121088 RepID=A0A8S1IVJ1_9CHLO|nr:unnamed protein product [Ostreobium quekettii]|eukprot:evm.model.scf_2403.2 EVM.evm.TU.scf_2403.2   scf_2403:12359-15454(-)